MLVRFSLAVGKEIFGVAALATFVYFPGKSWTDFDGAGLALLASDRQCYPCQLGVPKSVSFVVTDHAADKEVQQESFFGIGVSVEHGQFSSPTRTSCSVAGYSAREKLFASVRSR